MCIALGSDALQRPQSRLPRYGSRLEAQNTCVSSFVRAAAARPAAPCPGEYIVGRNPMRSLHATLAYSISRSLRSVHSTAYVFKAP